MRKSKISWTEKAWDITKGCKHNCLDLVGRSYCYTHRYLKDPLNPKLFPDKLIEPRMDIEPSVIFVAPSGDICGEWVPIDFIIEAFEIMNECSHHIFQLLTKNPKRYLEIPAKYFQPWIWLGTSITRSNEMCRADTMKQIDSPVKFISFEPLFTFIDSYDFTSFRWAIIGAQTVRNQYEGINIPQTHLFAKNLKSQLDRDGVPVFIKPNLKWPVRVDSMPDYYYEWKTKYSNTKDEQLLF